MSRWAWRSAWALAAACVLGALAQLLPLWRSFDTVALRQDRAAAGDSPGARLDAALLANLDHLRYARVFDHVFARGARTVRLAQPFWLDRCEARQGDFYKFANWRPFHADAPIAAPTQPPAWRHYSSNQGHAISGRLDAPASGVTWFDAYAYCRAAGGRLPTPAEWLAAATGAGHRLYPWGDTFDARPWPHLDPLLNAARPCGRTPSTDTPRGLADMGQNVAEWAADGAGAAAVMGGNAYNTPPALHSIAILHRRAPRDFRSSYVGFRCAYDRPPARTPWRTETKAIVVPAGEYAVGVPHDARLPGLLAHLPPQRFDLVRRMFQMAASAKQLHLTRREITRREYAAFLRDPFVVAGFHADENQPRRHRHRPADWRRQMRQPDLPVVNVDWWSAYAFASWAGGRLPTADEWASAASGHGQRLYPWGDDFAAASPVTGERALGGPQTASAASGDITPEGLLAMGGNVSEWTRSVSAASGGYAVVVKGGNYLLPGAQTARMDYSNHVSPHHRSRTLGFRVAFNRSRGR